MREGKSFQVKKNTDRDTEVQDSLSHCPWLGMAGTEQYRSSGGNGKSMRYWLMSSLGAKEEFIVWEWHGLTSAQEATVEVPVLE